MEGKEELKLRAVQEFIPQRVSGCVQSEAPQWKSAAMSLSN